MKVKEPLHLYDPDTAEVLKPEELLAHLDELTDDEVQELLDRSATILKGLGAAVEQIIKKMIDRAASAKLERKAQ